MRAAVILTLFLLGVPCVARGKVQVVSVLGSVKVQGEGESVTVRDSSVAQILMQRWALGLVGPLRARLEDPTGRVALLEETGALRLAGQGGAVVTRDGWRITLTSTDASVLLHQHRLFVLQGSASCAFKSASPPRTLTRGQAVLLGTDGTLQRVDAEPDPWLLGRSQAYQPPAPWTPEVSRLDPDLVQQARGWTRQQQQAAREMATCGCTESSGPGAGPVGGPDAFKPPEQRRAKIRIRVQGIPRIIQ